MGKIQKEEQILYKDLEVIVAAMDEDTSVRQRVRTKLNTRPGIDISLKHNNISILSETAMPSIQDVDTHLLKVVCDVYEWRIKRRPKASRSLKYLQGWR